MKLIKIIAYIFCYLFYPISFLVPRSKDIWIYGSYHGSFNDNSKHFFLYTNQNLSTKRHIWISTKRKTISHIQKLGYEAYWVVSPKGLWYALRGKYWFFNAYTSDILFCLSGGTTKVNLWHGIPWKCIEYDIKKGPLAKRYTKENKLDAFMHPAVFITPDYLVSAGNFMTDILSRSFRINKNQCIKSGCPRNLLLTKSTDEIIEYIKRYELPETFELAKRIQTFSKTYIYMPTWRDSQKDLFAMGIDLEQLNNLMAEQNALAIMKPHPNTKIPTQTDYSNLVFMDNSADVYCILPLTDVLITDYSSIMFDYPLMPDKGMILYQYDYDEYIAEREFNFPLEGNIIGKKIISFTDLTDCIRKQSYYIGETERIDFIKKFWGEEGNGNNACQIIVERLLCEA